jgi:hypothetical protein
MILRPACAFLALLAVATAGCQTPPPEPRAPVRMVAPEWDAAAAVSFAERFARLGAEAQRQEANELMAAFARNHDETARMRLALALGTPGSAVSDDARAAALLEPLANAAASEPRTSLRQLAWVLYAQITARQAEKRRGDTLKIEADAARADAAAAAKQTESARGDLKELRELRTQLENARKEAESQRVQAEAARSQADALRQQLEALKAVERTMIERGAPPPPRSPK